MLLPGVNRLKGEGPRQFIAVVVSSGDGGGGEGLWWELVVVEVNGCDDGLM